jgi:hypothetical protein
VEPLEAPNKCPLCHRNEGFRYLGAKPSPKMPHAADVRVWQCRKCLGYVTPDYIESRGRFRQYLG